MACGCLKRQAWLVKTLCKNGANELCKRAQARLEKMQAKEAKK
jgi:hypothetical protein